MPDFLNPAVAIDGLRTFLETGGPVLSVIMFSTFVLWAFIMERLFYWNGPGGFSADCSRARRQWAVSYTHLRAH